MLYGITLKNQQLPKEYYFSEWDEKFEFDFSGINLEIVYQKLIKAFIKDEAKIKDSFEATIELDTKIKRLGKEIQNLQNKIKKEKQFNRKVELNKTLLDKKAALNNLTTENTEGHGNDIDV